jgi:hypothetical protein
VGIGEVDNKKPNGSALYQAERGPGIFERAIIRIIMALLYPGVSGDFCVYQHTLRDFWRVVKG